jgi:hypothetical protein
MFLNKGKKTLCNRFVQNILVMTVAVQGCNSSRIYTANDFLSEGSYDIFIYWNWCYSEMTSSNMTLEM